MDKISGEVTTTRSILQSLTKKAIPVKSKFPRVQSRLMITLEKVLRSMLHHSTSAVTMAWMKS